MKKVLLSVLVMVFCSAMAFAWGSAGHAYVVARLLEGGNPQMTANVVYGAMLPDLFDYDFTVLCQDAVAEATHHQFAVAYGIPRNKPGKALAYGFITHNDEWGADFFAHHSGLTGGGAEGYVIAKASALLAVAPLPPELPLPPDKALSMYHNLVETAIDVLIARIDPTIGQQVATAALMRTPLAAPMLAAAYQYALADCFGGASYVVEAIAAAEKGFRKTMTMYGQSLAQDEATAIQLLAEQTADLAEGFLGGPLPMTREEAIGLIVQLLQGAMQLCAYDFAAELDADMIALGQRMADEGFSLSWTGRE